MIDEKEKTASLPLDTGECVPLHHVGAGQGPGEAESAAAPLLFRGLPIVWTATRQTRRVAERNAVGPDTISERPGRKVNLIGYNGQTYQKEQFYRMAFSDYKKYPYRVNFLTDDVFRLGGNQRAKLQYHILAQRFPLVEVYWKDKQELEAFAAASETETAQRWQSRMRWPQGHEKMVTFG